MKKLTLIILAIILTSALTYFLNTKNQNNNSSTNKLQISTSFYPLYFFASQIGGDKAQIHNITPAGAEPHDYDLSTQDLTTIEKGNLLILNGIVEPWADKIKNNLSGTKIKIITVGEGIISKNLDPHIWLDPNLAKKEVEKITQGYIAIDPANTNYYQQNQTSLNQKLDQLDTQYKTSLANCQTRDIITSHAAFTYLANRYDLKQISISGLSPDEEPSAKQLAKVAEFAKQNNVKYIFFESLVSPKLSETIANEIGAATLVLDPIERIPDDEIKQGKNYFTIMEDNLKNLQKALSCQN